MGFQKGHTGFRTKDSYELARTKISNSLIGKKLSEQHKINLSKAHLGQKAWNKGIKMPEISGENHYAWKGEEVGYVALHEWVERNLGRPAKCEFCKTIDAKKFEWANKSGEYKRDLSDWVRLCTMCHNKYDDTGEKIWMARRRNNTVNWKK